MYKQNGPITFSCLLAACPSWSGKTCNSHGTCLDGHGGNGTCMCEVSVLRLQGLPLFIKDFNPIALVNDPIGQ